MTDVYKLVTERKSNGDYSTELTHNGKKIDLENTKKPLNSVLLDSVFALDANNIEVLSHFRDISRLETVISGDLK